MSLLDLLVVVLAIGFAVSGFRQGFLTATLSFVAFALALPLPDESV